jgi:hypothetical protein
MGIYGKKNRINTMTTPAMNIVENIVLLSLASDQEERCQNYLSVN